MDMNQQNAIAGKLVLSAVLEAERKCLLSVKKPEEWQN